ncbi:MAG: hypothetical protein Q8O89_02820 [Nanoarchaeota archaeon]|nr:hypothetical protein [Nanoarchaeota archaeon]
MNKIGDVFTMWPFRRKNHLQEDLSNIIKDLKLTEEELKIMQREHQTLFNKLALLYEGLTPTKENVAMLLGLEKEVERVMNNPKTGAIARVVFKKFKMDLHRMTTDMAKAVDESLANLL